MNEEDICPHCGYHSKGGITAMKFHMITKHNDTSFGEVHIYKCQYCDFQTYGRQRHRIHVKKKHEIPLGKNINVKGSFRFSRIISKCVLS